MILELVINMYSNPKGASPYNYMYTHAHSLPCNRTNHTQCIISSSQVDLNNYLRLLWVI